MAVNPTLPRTAMTVHEARSTLSCLHFAKEVLSEGERELLHIAEGLLRLVDSFTGDALSGSQERMRILARTPGVHEATIHVDGVAFVGSNGEAGFVSGGFSVAQVRVAVGEQFPVRDVR